MKHEDVWRALDTLAAEKGLSPSGLARAAGLDPTAFNRSKRSTRNGPRWPSTESLSRVLAATGASLESFTALVGGARALTMGRGHRARHLPLLPLSRLDGPGLFDSDGHPSGVGWEETEVPQPADPAGYAVRLDGPGLEPVFREGGTLILSPEAALRPGDRTLLWRDGAGTQAAILTGTGADTLGIRILGGACDRGGLVARDSVLRMHRIVWASF